MSGDRHYAEQAGKGSPEASQAPGDEPAARGKVERRTQQGHQRGVVGQGGSELPAGLGGGVELLERQPGDVGKYAEA
ncbi:MAG: hypothetical protein KY393_03545 [Actinobacteria bacterium]|nr:hypothetical protein [Actinomycetota bacterium]